MTRQTAALFVTCCYSPSCTGGLMMRELPSSLQPHSCSKFRLTFCEGKDKEKPMDNSSCGAWPVPLFMLNSNTCIRHPNAGVLPQSSLDKSNSTGSPVRQVLPAAMPTSWPIEEILCIRHRRNIVSS
ncbi:hypothetical protein VPH35_118506 [Triticum aestivum]